MKLTKREKTLLIFLGVMILIGGYYQFILGPQMSKIKELEKDAEAYRNEVNRVKIEISSNSKIHKEFKIMNSKIVVVSERLFPKIIQEKIITILDEMISTSKIKGLSMAFSEEELKEIEGRKEKIEEENYVLNDLVLEYEGKLDTKDNNAPKNKNYNSEKDQSQEQIEKTTITISYEGTYDEIMAFVEEIEAFNKKIIIKSLTLTKPEVGNMVGNIVLDFYALSKIHEEDGEYLNWSIENEYGRDNPFDKFSGYTSGSSKKEDSPLKKKTNYDFIMTVKPITSDLPTVIIGKTKDRAMKSYVYADNENFENVEFEITEEEGTYYYRYKTQSESYPRDYDNGKVEFVPNGKNIEFNIITHKRNSSEDTSGVNLSLINRSNLKLNVKINYDDSKKTRVNVVKNVGNIEVKR